MIQNPTRYTGEGFANEKALAYLGLFISGSILLIMAFDVYHSHRQRKLDMQLSTEQLKEVKRKNGST